MAKITPPSRLYAKLRKLEPSIEKAVRAVLSREANALVREIKAAAPEDTGALKASIGWAFGRAPKGKLSLGSIRLRSHSTRVTIYAGSEDAFYARFVEFLQQSYFWDTYRSRRGKAKSAIIGAAKSGIRGAIK